jgi:hypothetical protein
VGLTIQDIREEGQNMQVIRGSGSDYSDIREAGLNMQAIRESWLD